MFKFDLTKLWIMQKRGSSKHLVARTHPAVVILHRQYFAYFSNFVLAALTLHNHLGQYNLRWLCLDGDEFSVV